MTTKTTFKQALRILTENKNAYLGEHYYGLNEVQLFNGNEVLTITSKTFEKLEARLVLRIVKHDMGFHTYNEKRYYFV